MMPAMPQKDLNKGLDITEATLACYTVKGWPHGLFIGNGIIGYVIRTYVYWFQNKASVKIFNRSFDHSGV